MVARDPILAVSVALQHTDSGAFLLVKRGREPSKGRWAFAGGRVEFGETLQDAAARELMEETGLASDDMKLLEHLEFIQSEDSDQGPAHHYLLSIHTGTARGNPHAADDAEEARWVTIDQFAELDVTQSTFDIANRLSKRA